MTAPYPDTEANRALARRIFLERLEDCRRFPKYFTIETCNSCNARCTMCPKSLETGRPAELMDDALFARIAAQLGEQADWVESVCLNSDGEPTLDRKLPERIALLKAAGLRRVNFTTNGALLKGDFAARILASGIDEVYISIDSDDPGVFAAIRVGLKLEQVRANALDFLALRDRLQAPVKVRIRLVEMEENRDGIEAWAARWRPHLRPGDRLQSMPAHTWSGLVGAEREENLSGLSDQPCVSPFSSMAINWDGMVQLCDSDVRQQVLLGDTRGERLEDIWRSGGFERIRAWHAGGRRDEVAICRGCDHWSRGFVDR